MGRSASNLGVQLNCDIPHTVGDSMQCTGNAMAAPVEREFFRSPELLFAKKFNINHPAVANGEALRLS
jgi:hypothetical protein